MQNHPDLDWMSLPFGLLTKFQGTHNFPVATHKHIFKKPQNCGQKTSKPRISVPRHPVTLATGQAARHSCQPLCVPHSQLARHLQGYRIPYPLPQQLVTLSKQGWLALLEDNICVVQHIDVRWEPSLGSSRPLQYNSAEAVSGSNWRHALQWNQRGWSRNWIQLKHVPFFFYFHIKDRKTSRN